jgi:uncharacterized protein YktA (UPF0223 family)
MNLTEKEQNFKKDLKIRVTAESYRILSEITKGEEKMIVAMFASSFSYEQYAVTYDEVRRAVKDRLEELVKEGGQ